MPRKILIGAPDGNPAESKRFVDFVINKSREGQVVLICGSKTLINGALRAAGHDIRFAWSGRRIITSENQAIVMDAIKRERDLLREKFMNIDVTIEMPIFKLGAVYCILSVEAMIKAGCFSFDDVFVFTPEDRYKEKFEVFQNFLDNVKIGLL